MNRSYLCASYWRRSRRREYMRANRAVSHERIQDSSYDRSMKQGTLSCTMGNGSVTATSSENTRFAAIRSLRQSWGSSNPVASVYKCAQSGNNEENKGMATERGSSDRGSSNLFARAKGVDYFCHGEDCPCL